MEALRSKGRDLATSVLLLSSGGGHDTGVHATAEQHHDAYPCAPCTHPTPLCTTDMTGPVPLSTGNPGSGASATARGSRRPPPSHLVDGYRSTPAFPSSLLCLPAASSSSPPSHLPRALRTRGGANLVPPQKTDGGTGSSSRPVLGPITRRGAAADSAAKDGAALEDGQQEFSPQFLDFQSRVGFMKKVGVGQERESTRIDSIKAFCFFRQVYIFFPVRPS